ncbi:hypothetical protein GRI39_08540 [Altererythrobacter indicus]|uniref:Uncharacterized protein n=1 Tax=Altericroceibacterium indicum TaxID=374177 RepID=A0A845A9Z8_9SPHN|nr:hypothetical protein [Altericroceibacterium indicum]MXP26083.1 hypothetical protein [Altericroceibacterium indicum]
MSFLRSINPVGAVSDFAVIWKENPYRWRVLIVSAALTVGIFMLLLPKSQRIPPRPPEVIYISTFAEGRTEAEILASNLSHQKKKEALEDLLAQREELRKDLYRKLGKATFLDVDKLEKQMEPDEDKDKAKKEAELARLKQEQDAAIAAIRSGKPEPKLPPVDTSDQASTSGDR